MSFAVAIVLCVLAAAVGLLGAWWWNSRKQRRVRSGKLAEDAERLARRTVEINEDGEAQAEKLRAEVLSGEGNVVDRRERLRDRSRRMRRDRDS
ncbi:MAG: hypothetical protein V3U43_00325 [Pseudomonadales bacterium]